GTLRPYADSAVNLAEHLHRAAKARPSSPAIYEGATLAQTHDEPKPRRQPRRPLVQIRVGLDERCAFIDGGR
ncbi:MAG: hypothetical protein AAF869_12150, partial [Pseudomonadota bacterium]